MLLHMDRTRRPFACLVITAIFLYYMIKMMGYFGSWQGGLKKPYRNSDQFVHIYDLTQAVTDTSEVVELGRKLKQPVQICIHNITKDRYVSLKIQNSGYFQRFIVDEFLDILSENPDMGVIDLGANIGQFTLFAAYMGRRVIAVEAKLKHVSMIHRSLVLNNFQSHVTLLHNAILDERKMLALVTPDDNEAGTAVSSIESSSASNIETGSAVDSQSRVQSILLDDLAPLTDFKRALIKMDIEGCEDLALSHADALFDKVDIQYILMEWVHVKRKGRVIVLPLLGWMADHSFQALDCDRNVLVVHDWKDWPNDILLRRV